MWLAKGPFGAGVVAKDPKAEGLTFLLVFAIRVELTRRLVSKVLKTNRDFAVGRKPEFPLRIDSKKVSNNHCVITVGEFSEDDMVRDHRLLVSRELTSC